MRKRDRLHYGCKALLGTFILLAAMLVALTADSYAIIGRAESIGKVTATSAKIRKEPSTSSDTLASVAQNAVLSVKGQTTGSDGYVWYQVDDSGTTGYIRSDLMTITDGSTPATIVSSTGSQTVSTPTTSTPDETVVEVTEVEPVSASVSGSSPVRVRQNASTTSRIVNTAQVGLALTVTGQAVGTDGQDWYQVSFTSGGSEVKGFIRAQYVTVSGELVPAGTASVDDDPEQGGDTAPEPVEETKDWDTYYEGDKWHLLDNTSGNVWDIENIFSSVEDNQKTLQEMLDKNKTQQIIVIVLVILLILLATALSFVIFKLKDMTDAAYYNEVERETMHRRTADRPVERSGNGQRAVQAGGNESTRRPAGQRPPGAGGNAQRPAGQRPPGAGGNAQRPAGQRPSGAGGNVKRPVNRQQAEQQRQARSQSQQSSQGYAAEYDSEYEQESQMQETSSAQSQRTGWKAKNFINDDEFEFQFLDWEDDQQ